MALPKVAHRAPNRDARLEILEEMCVAMARTVLEITHKREPPGLDIARILSRLAILEGMKQLALPAGPEGDDHGDDA